MRDYVYTNELYHFGTKGMKWGVRKDEQSQPQKKKQAASWNKRKRKYIAY